MIYLTLYISECLKKLQRVSVYVCSLPTLEHISDKVTSLPTFSVTNTSQMN